MLGKESRAISPTPLIRRLRRHLLPQGEKGRRPSSAASRGRNVQALILGSSPRMTKAAEVLSARSTEDSDPAPPKIRDDSKAEIAVSPTVIHNRERTIIPLPGMPRKPNSVSYMDGSNPIKIVSMIH